MLSKYPGREILRQHVRLSHQLPHDLQRPLRRKSSVIDRFPRFSASKYEQNPSAPTPSCRPGSPFPGISTFSTSAPMSASIAVACGPFWYRVKSTTLTPSKGAGIAIPASLAAPPKARPSLSPLG